MHPQVWMRFCQAPQLDVVEAVEVEVEQQQSCQTGRHLACVEIEL